MRIHLRPKRGTSCGLLVPQIIEEIVEIALSSQERVPCCTADQMCSFTLGTSSQWRCIISAETRLALVTIWDPTSSVET